MSARFGPVQHKAALQHSLPIVAEGSKDDTAKAYDHLKKEWSDQELSTSSWSDDFPMSSPASPTVFDTEWMQWVKKWQGTNLEKPDNPQEALKELWQWTHFLRTSTPSQCWHAPAIPVTSAKTERCNVQLYILVHWCEGTENEDLQLNDCMRGD